MLTNLLGFTPPHTHLQLDRELNVYAGSPHFRLGRELGSGEDATDPHPSHASAALVGELAHIRVRLVAGTQAAIQRWLRVCGQSVAETLQQLLSHRERHVVGHEVVILGRGMSGVTTRNG